MTDRPREEPLNDAALDRALEEALAVDPSPGFVARVRTRVARDTSLRGTVRLGRWGFVSAGTVAAAAVLAMYVGASSWGQDSGGPQTTAATSPVSPEIPRNAAAGRDRGGEPARIESPDVSVRPESATSLSAPSREGAASRGGASAAAPSFEVMVSASELIALRQLLSMTQRGITIEERPAAADTADAEQMPEIVIEPITIAPIVLAKIEGAAE